MQALSVQSLNQQIKTLIESTFTQILVQGEISNLSYHSSGHIYFGLKDDNSYIGAIMFRGNASKLKFRLEIGQSVIVSAMLSVYMPTGKYQINCLNIHPQGDGALSLAFKQLKTQLEKEGLFDPKHKKSLPKYPRHIAIITGHQSAALADMQKIASQRFPICRLTIIPTLVQGEHAKDEIVKQLQFADTLGVDIIVLARGGGSLEDLWAFNEYQVALSIFKTKTPVISAIGHESDVMISDFVADQRYSTPSHAMQSILPDQYELLQTLSQQRDLMQDYLKFILQRKREDFLHNKTLILNNPVKQRILNTLEKLTVIKQQLHNQYLVLWQEKQQKLQYATLQIESVNPNKKLKEHEAQLRQNDQNIALDKLKLDDEFLLLNAKVKVKAKVLQSTNIES